MVACRHAMLSIKRVIDDEKRLNFCAFRLQGQQTRNGCRMNLEQSGDLGSGFLAGSQHGDNFWFCRKVFERPTRISNCESAKWLASSIAAPDVIGYCPSIDLCDRTQNDASLLLLKTMIHKFQCPAIFGHSAHNMIRHPVPNLRCHLQCHRHCRTDKPREMCDHLVGNFAGIASDASSIEGHRSVNRVGFAITDWGLPGRASPGLPCAGMMSLLPGGAGALPGRGEDTKRNLKHA